LTYNNKVIVLEKPPRVLWRFFDFAYGPDSNPIIEWYDKDISDEARLLIDGLLKTNQKIENPLNWMGFRKYLKGALKPHKIWEMEFHCDVRQYRLLGIFRGEKIAVFLVGCYHKGPNYTPPNALDTAVRRKKTLDQGGGQLHERKVKTDQ
jgi:predicted small lipoprotein YifL